MRVLIGAPIKEDYVRVQATDSPYQTAEPQKTGWPLTDEERTYILKPEHERRPGRESNKHLPAMWPVVPSAGNCGCTSWLDMFFTPESRAMKCGSICPRCGD